MAAEKKVKFKAEDLTIFKTVISTYEIITATAMQRVRSSVLASREFNADLDTVFKEVRASYQNQLVKLERRRKLVYSLIPAAFRKSAKTIYVLLSANTGLYGDIIPKTFELFLNETDRNKPDDLAVIGKIGQTLFKTVRPKTGFEYFDFPDTGVSATALKNICEHLKSYREVVVFHGSFKSILTQIPVFASVSGSVRSSETPEMKVETRYRFEPALSAIFKFFETEIFSILVEQVFHESRLAKLASRLILLDSASANADRYLDRAIFERQKERHRNFNRKQVNTYGSFELWQ